MLLKFFIPNSSYLKKLNFSLIRKMSFVPRKKFNNGLEIPALGLGTYKEENEAVLIEAVKSALRCGYRHIDSAPVYYNELPVGHGIREAISESQGSLKREDIFITSKCWCTFFSKEKVPVCLDKTLSNLGMGYLDLYLIHWPMGFKENEGFYPEDANGKVIPSDVHYLETYRAMEELVKNGKVKSIGVSNFNIKQLQDVLDHCEIKPVCNQFEVHPFLQNDELVDFCHKNEIVVVAYAPLGAPDRSWSKPDDPKVLDNQIIHELAEKHNKTPGQIILRWLVQRNIVVIPKSVNPGRIEENSKIFDFNLDDEDMDAFKNIKEQFRYYSFDECDNHSQYPFKL